MFTMPRYEGPLEAGMVFRHTSFDIRCEVVSVAGFSVITRPIDCEGKRSTETIDYPLGTFRTKWMVERRSPARW